MYETKRPDMLPPSPQFSLFTALPHSLSISRKNKTIVTIHGPAEKRSSVNSNHALHNPENFSLFFYLFCDRYCPGVMLYVFLNSLLKCSTVSYPTVSAMDSTVWFDSLSIFLARLSLAFLTASWKVIPDFCLIYLER